jgi:hypothetical protein
MLANDSVTIACEVPVWIDDEDVEHFRDVLGFEIPDIFGTTKNENTGRDNSQSSAAMSGPGRQVLTGHIDILQLRNGSVHIIDYKPNAKKEKPIEQLTIYALALSRLTGLRLHDFKCAWFDDKNYYEFFPLHIVYKIGKHTKIDKSQVRLKDVGVANGLEKNL